MIPCHQCSKEVPFGSALLTEDLEAKPLAFCSDVCHGLWSEDFFATPSRSTNNAAESEGGPSASVDVRSLGFRNSTGNL